ncbi:MAG: PepSY domain-containing protein [Gemmatimonadota bacterium]
MDAFRQTRLSAGRAGLVMGLALAGLASCTGEVRTKEAEPGLAAQARIDDATARRTALARVPGGEIESAELEREEGRLVYSFDIEVDGEEGVQEVWVDATTGAIVRVEHESAEHEAAEHEEEGHASEH